MRRGGVRDVYLATLVSRVISIQVDSIMLGEI
jgi:hypothetical protein